MRPLSLRLIASLFGLVALTSCVDGDSPLETGETRSAAIALQPVFQQSSAAATAQPITRIRVTAVRVSDGSVIEQQVTSVDPNASQWTIGLELDVPSGAVQIQVRLELLSVSGDSETVEWSGMTDVLGIGGGQTPPPAQRVEVIRGPLGNLFVTAVSVDPESAEVVRGSTVDLTAQVQTSRQDEPARVLWTSLDPNVASVQRTGPRSATVTTLQEGTARIEAQAGEATATSTIAVTPRLADLVVQKSVDVDAAFEGDAVTFTVAVTNDGPQTATGISLVDDLPEGLLFQSAEPGQGTFDDATGVWAVGDLADGARAELLLTAVIADGTAGTTLTNTAMVQGSADQVDPDPSDNEASASVAVEMPRADLALQKTVDPGEAGEGDPVTFTLTLTNDGPDGATGVTVQDILPDGLTFESTDPSEAFEEGGGLWNVGDLSAGSSATLQLVARIDQGMAGTTLTNTARVLELTDQLDPDPSDNEASASVDVEKRIADLSVQKSVTPDAGFVGDVATFTVTVTNDGPADATGVSLTDQLPTGLAFRSATPAGAYDEESGVWTVGDLAANESATLTLEAVIGAGTAGTTLTNTARSNGLTMQIDPDGTNDQASAGLSVGFLTDLAVSKTVNRSEALVEQSLTYTVTATNRGPDDATGVVVTDQLPAQLDLGSVSTSQGGFDRATGTWTIGALAAGSSVTLTLQAVILEAPDGTELTNRVEISGGGGQVDRDESNDRASATTVVKELRRLEGSYSVADRGDLDAFAEAGYGVIEGSLRIVGSSVTDLTGLESLIEVLGDVEIAGNPSLISLRGLVNLQRVRGSVSVVDNPQLSSVTPLLKLEEIGIDLILEDNPAVSSPRGLPALTKVGRSVVIEGGGVVLGFPALATIGGDLFVGGSEGDPSVLEELFLSILTEVAGEVSIYGNTSLTTVDLQALESVGANPPPVAESLTVATPFPSRVRQAPARIAAQSTAQRVVEKRIRAVEDAIRGLESELGLLAGQESGDDGEQEMLEDLREKREDLLEDRSRIQAIVTRSSEEEEVPDTPSDLAIFENPSLSTLRLESLAFVGGWVGLAYNESLTALTLASLETVVKGLVLYNTYLSSFAVPLLTSLGADLVLVHNEVTLDFRAPALASIGYGLLLYENAALAGFGLPSLASVGRYVDISYNSWNSALDLPLLESVGDDFYVTDNAGLSAIEAATGASLDLGGSLIVVDNTGLVRVDVPGLRTLGLGLECEYCFGDLLLLFNPDLEHASFPGLESVKDVLAVLDNGVDSGEFSDAVGSTFSAGGMVADAHGGPPLELDFSSLRTVGADLSVVGNPGLSELELPALTGIGVGSFPGQLDVSHLPHLVRLSAPVLQTITDDLELDFNGSGGVPLVVELPMLKSVGDDFDIDGNPTLEELVLPSLMEIGDDFEMDEHPKLGLLRFASLVSVGESPVTGPGDFEVWDSGTPGQPLAFDFPSLERIGDDLLLAAGPNHGLQTVTLPALAWIGEDVEILGQPDLTDFSADMLDHIRGSVIADANPVLAGIALPVLTVIGADPSSSSASAVGPGSERANQVAPIAGNLILSRNPVLSTVQTDALVSVPGRIDIHENPALPDLDALRAVVSTVYAVFVSDNASLTSVLGLARLGDLGGGDPVVADDFFITDNPSLCQSNAAELLNILDGKFQGVAVGGAVDITTGNRVCASLSGGGDRKP